MFYAKTAISHQEENIANSCNFKGDYWSLDYQSHLQFCEVSRLNLMDGINKARVKSLNKCALKVSSMRQQRGNDYNSYDEIKKRAKIVNSMRLNSNKSQHSPPSDNIRVSLASLQQTIESDEYDKFVINTAAIASAAKGDKNSFCDDFANLSLEQSYKNTKLDCGYIGNGWANNYDVHYRWCSKSKKSKVLHIQAIKSGYLADCKEENRKKLYSRTAKSSSDGFSLSNMIGGIFQGPSSNTSRYDFNKIVKSSSSPKTTILKLFETNKGETLDSILIPSMKYSHKRGELTFYGPKMGNSRLDWCKGYAYGCGKVSAISYCKEQGMGKLKNYKKEEDVGRWMPTTYIATRRKCNDKYCDGFAYITCAK